MERNKYFKSISKEQKTTCLLGASDAGEGQNPESSLKKGICASTGRFSVFFFLSGNVSKIADKMAGQGHIGPSPKAWFPYNRPDRPNRRPDRLKMCSGDRDDHMEMLQKN